LNKAESSELEAWFEWANKELDKMHAHSGKLESTYNYLQANSNVETNGEY
jgi:hypothetical protein